MIAAIIKSLRPIQWTKNLLLFAGPVFSQRLFIFNDFFLSAAAFGLFCIISGSTYIFNDILDLPSDREHPVKSQRPIASGRLSPVTAGVIAGFFSAGAIYCAFLLDRNFGLICLFYFIMTISYSLILKNIIILDSLIVAMGFVIRAVAGTLVIHVDISKWLLVCTIFLALFLALSKRLSELKAMKEWNMVTRKVLKKYSPDLLIQLISITASSALIAYTLYTLDNATVEKFGTRNLVYTVPFVIYGIFRYMFLIHSTEIGESPELILLTDIPTLLNIALYTGFVFYIIY